MQLPASVNTWTKLWNPPLDQPVTPLLLPHRPGHALFRVWSGLISLFFLRASAVVIPLGYGVVATCPPGCAVGGKPLNHYPGNALP